MANNTGIYEWCKFTKNNTVKVSGDKMTPVGYKMKPTEPVVKKSLTTKTPIKTKTPMKKSDKPINKKSKNKEEVTPATYKAVLERDKQCRLKDINCKGKLDLHHINSRGKGRTNNIDNCCMLCEYHHLEIVHKNNKKYRPLLNEMIKTSLNMQIKTVDVPTSHKNG